MLWLIYGHFFELWNVDHIYGTFFFFIYGTFHAWNRECNFMYDQSKCHAWNLTIPELWKIDHAWNKLILTHLMFTNYTTLCCTILHYSTLHYTTLHYTCLEISCRGYNFVCLFVKRKSFKCVIAVEVLVQIVLVHELKATQVTWVLQVKLV